MLALNAPLPEHLEDYEGGFRLGPMTREQTRRARREGLAYRRANRLTTHKQEAAFVARTREARRKGVPTFTTELRAVLHRGDGTYIDLGVLSRRIVTTAGVNYLASTLINTAEPENINFHDSGTGTTAAAIGDTALQTATGNARVSGTQTNPSANIYRSVATLAYTGTAAITEWGLFTASSVGTLFDHFVFSAVNVINGDSIAFTFNLTLSAGG